MAAGKACGGKLKEDTAEWTRLFQSEVKTEQHSVVFVKRMMALAVSSITYLRGIFPEEAYRSRYLEDLCIKILRDDCTTPGACKVVKWMMGSFDALEKRYLQIVFIGVHTNRDEPDCIIECYQFKFKYTPRGPQVDLVRNNNVEMQVTMEHMKKASMLLIRKLFLLMQNLSALPNDISLNMKLYYYDDVTPADYEPPGFKEGICNSMMFEGTAVHFRLGEVQTTYHSLKMQVAAEEGRVEKLHQGNHLRESGLHQLEGEQLSSTQEPSGRITDEDLPSENESAQFKKPKRPSAKRKRVNKFGKKKKKTFV